MSKWKGIKEINKKIVIKHMNEKIERSKGNEFTWTSKQSANAMN